MNILRIVRIVVSTSIEEQNIFDFVHQVDKSKVVDIDKKDKL